MIKKFNLFESMDEKILFHKGEIVLRPLTYAGSHDTLYLLLQDVHESDESVRVFEMGSMGGNWKNEKTVYLIFRFDKHGRGKKKHNNIYIIRNNSVANGSFVSFRKLTFKEYELVQDYIYNDKYIIYLDNIESETGIDLRLPAYKFQEEREHSIKTHLGIDPFGEEEWLEY